MRELKVITEPKVYLIARQELHPGDPERFLRDEGVPDWTTDTDVDGDAVAEIGGRLCYMSFANPRPGGNAKYLEHIKEVGHGSVLEHAVYTLILTGVSRSLTHELIRHRAGMSYSQLSQRYVDESDVAFVVPPLLLKAAEKNPHLLVHWKKEMAKVLETYTDLADDLSTHIALTTYEAAGGDYDIKETEWQEWVDSDYAGWWLKQQPNEVKTAVRKTARESARSVLPNATETKIQITGNARAWRHFVEMRASEHADAEIRRAAVAVLRTLQKESENLFGDYEIVTLPDGSEAVTTPYRKV